MAQIKTNLQYGVTGTVQSANIANDAIDSQHYADGSLDTAHIADDQITLAKMASGTDGNVITYDASGNPAVVATGTSGHFLKSQGAGSVPVFAAAGGSNSPYFLAYNVNSTTISNSTTTTMPFGNEVYDPDSTYDTSTYRWTPAVAGRYYLFSMCVMNAANIGSSAQQNYTMLNKAGTSIANSIWVGGSGSTIRPVNQISVLYDLTDTTDYFYVTIYHNSGNTNQTYTGRPTQYFGGFRLI